MSQVLVDQSYSQNSRGQWLLVILLSLLLHSVVVLWFSSRKLDFPKTEVSEFKVGLVSSEGMGETLQSSFVEIAAVSDVASKEVGLVTQEAVVSEFVSQSISEQLPLVAQDITDIIELASVVAPEISELPDISPPAIRDIQAEVEHYVEEARPVTITEVSISSATSVDLDVAETVGVASDFIEVAPSNDFFKQAEVLTADVSMTVLSIEQLAAVPAPEAISELSHDDVEILQIKARDVLSQRQQNIKRSELSKIGDGSLHPKQSSINTLVVEPEKATPAPLPLVIPKHYILELKSWLSQHKQYPQEAYRLEQEGVAIIGLVIDRSGQILSYQIRKSSGHEILDQAVELMIKRAGKMPALPDDFPRESLELLIPVSFKKST